MTLLPLPGDLLPTFDQIRALPYKERMAALTQTIDRFDSADFAVRQRDGRRAMRLPATPRADLNWMETGPYGRTHRMTAYELWASGYTPLTAA